MRTTPTTAALTTRATAMPLSTESSARYVAAGYTVRVAFSKTFTQGALAGMTVRDSIPHVDAAHAKAWMRGVTVAVGLGYTYHDMQIVPL